MLPKIHKEENSGRLQVNNITYLDEHLRKLIPGLPSYINDITHFLNIIDQIMLDPNERIVTIYVSSLYTNILHNEGISTLTKMTDKVGTDTHLHY